MNDHLLTCAALATVTWTPLAIPMLTVNYPTRTGKKNSYVGTAILFKQSCRPAKWKHLDTIFYLYIGLCLFVLFYRSLSKSTPELDEPKPDIKG